jgi:hypothetical protein
MLLHFVFRKNSPCPGVQGVMYCRQSAHRSMNAVWKFFGTLFLALAVGRAAATTFYVNVSNTVPLAPYTNWATAAKTIQIAVDIATEPGSLVLVTNGTYEVGGVFYISQTNRLLVTNPIIVKSVNGPDKTFIYGYPFIGAAAVRGVYMGTGAKLDGFSVLYGATRYSASGGIPLIQQAGGGIYCEASNCVVTNCLIAGNSGGLGAGIYGGNLNMCRIAFNHGSAIYSANVSRSVIHNNDQSYAVEYCTLDNCLVVSNIVGGVFNSIVNNSTVVSNYFGIVDSLVTNSIVYFNSGLNFDASAFPQQATRLKNCCTTPFPSLYGYSAGGNFTNQPILESFSAGNFHLRSNSPCINASINSSANSMSDLDGNPRIVGGTVDIGAYEFQSPSSVLSYAWAQQFRLPTDGSADFIDSDGDGLNNWQEWIAGVVPTNAASVLRLNPPTNAVTGLQVSWQSVNTRTYFLQRSTNLLAAPAFTAIQSNLVGGSVTTTFTDTSATNGGPYFYRVGVQ